MHGRSCHPGPPAMGVPATVPARPSPTMPAVETCAGRLPAAEPPRAPGQRITSPGATGMTIATLPHRPSGSAVVHLGGSRARVAREMAPGSTEIVSVPRRSRARDPEPYLVRVLRAVGDRAPVVIAGLADERTALEREITRFGQHLDRFVEDPNLDDADDALRRRLRALHSHPG